jgi:hypothetical protein
MADFQQASRMVLNLSGLLFNGSRKCFLRLKNSLNLRRIGRLHLTPKLRMLEDLHGLSRVIFLDYS